MTERELYYIAEAHKLMATLSRWNYDESMPEGTALAFSGEGTPWTMVEGAARICLQYAGFTIQEVDELISFYYETGESFANGIKFLSNS